MANETGKRERKNGMGGVIQVPGSKNWYIIYRVNGRQIKESSGSPDKAVAEKLLNRRLAEDDMGLRPAQDIKSLKYEDIRDSYIQDCRNRECSFIKKADGTDYLRGVPELNAYFTGMRVTAIGDEIQRYIQKRKKQGASGPTAARELRTLRAAFFLAKEQGKLALADVPYFSLPKESKARRGFLDLKGFETLRDALPKDLRPTATFLYYTGCRTGAAKQITWEMVSSDNTEIELPGEIAKNDEAQNLPLVGPLEEISALLKEMRKKFPKPNDRVFSFLNFRNVWNATCGNLGLGKYDVKTRKYTGLRPHDFRRSAARNLIKAGVTRRVAMKITNHKTEDVFERYNITNSEDVKEALIKVGQYKNATVIPIQASK